VPNEVTPTDSWRSYIRSVDYVEQETGYDFFSNIPAEIQNDIETNLVLREASSFPSASLLAELDETDALFSISNASVWHDRIRQDGLSLQPSPIMPQPLSIPEISVPQNASSQGGFIQKRALEISTRQVSTIQTSLVQSSIAQIGISKNSFIQDSLLEASSNQASVSQVSSMQVDPLQIGIVKVGSSQVGSSQISSQSSPTQISFAQISPAQVDELQIGSTQISSTQIDPWKLSFPRVASPQEFFSSHNFNLQNTTVPTWTEFLQGHPSFNLNIEFSDLPVGQLADSSITSFNRQGTPIAGTLTLDTDANGLGWYLDPTPEDHIEYTTSLTPTAFKSTPGSPAYGHYDLLTTILHELGHIQGIISGNSAYDTHIQNQTFIGYGKDSDGKGPFDLRCLYCKVFSDRSFCSSGARSQRESAGFSDRKQ
jgi:hypothetical protein